MTVTAHKESLPFQTEVRQLLDLMIHSLYSNKEVFLRELISNASDASDKLRFEALSRDSLYEGDPEMTIAISFDKEKRELRIRDKGIGMTREEVQHNIGTIARSGTKEFLKALSGDQVKDAQLIGQFGVGFYSAFIVSDRVSLITRRAGAPVEEGVRWESVGDGTFTLETVEVPQRGTEVVLHLKEGEEEFLDGWRLRSIVRKFSDHLSWPILLPKDKEKGEEGEEKEPAEVEWETVNRAQALWMRPKSELTAEDYNGFYKHLSHDYQDPLAHLHARLEGKYEYTLLLYLPQRAPFDMWDRDRREGLKLYVRRVFIMDCAEEILPRYLRFVRGLVDSADLPLNVSREILQHNQVVETIRKGAVSRVLGLVEELIEKEPEKFATFWRQFGVVMKEGLIEDYANRERLAKLMRFASSHDPGAGQVFGLADYVKRMKEGQEKIYYVLGESRETALSSPHLEIFRKKEVEVLLLTDRVDEWMVSHLTEFEGKELQSVSQGALDLGKLQDEKEKESQESQAEAHKDFVKRVQECLKERVKEVRISSRLTESPSCLVGEEHQMSVAMERLLKEAGQEVPVTKRTLELNADHALVQGLEKESDEGRFADWCHILYDQALLTEGGRLADPAGFVRRLNGLYVNLLG
ncbi:MAG: molecular chaperone HtpG [Magnetococcales bacterium]|nr:molecular chaperone HtpG [Magnetococcales bacterium]